MSDLKTIPERLDAAQTGEEFGGLCLSCNTFLGRVEANSAILSRMAAYAGLDTPCHADVLLELVNGGSE